LWPKSELSWDGEPSSSSAIREKIAKARSAKQKMNLATRKRKIVKPPRDDACWRNSAKNPFADEDNASSTTKSSSSEAFEGPNTREIAFLTSVLLATSWTRIATMDSAAKYAGKIREFVHKLQRMK
jgi:hypothetical protein